MPTIRLTDGELNDIALALGIALQDAEALRGTEEGEALAEIERQIAAWTELSDRLANWGYPKADLLSVGTRVRTNIDLMDDDEGVERHAPTGTEGVIGQVFPDQEHCYSVEFDTGVLNFFSPGEIANGDLEVIPC